MLDAERYRRIDEIFQAALALDPAERSSYLSHACSGDQLLIKEVEYLLSSDEQHWELIGTPAFEMVAPLLAIGRPQLSHGDLIANYKIISLLGVGGMGEVYLAEDSELGRKIAIKLLPAEFTTNEERVKRFRQEARAASALNHPNILTIHQISQSEDRYFIATEFIDGETLRQRLRRSSLSNAEALEIAIQIAEALAAAHSAGIIHRDIKPENIMLRRDGYVKVLDFGLAKLTEQQESAREMRAAEDVNISSGLLMGTVNYMSPEQARGLSVDARTDIFSVGVVLYEMVSGHVPFTGEGVTDLIRSVVRDEPRPLKEFAPTAPAELQRIVSKALNTNRTKRYQAVADLVTDLSTLRQQLNLATRSHRVIGRAEDGAVSARTVATIDYAVTQILRNKVSATFGALSLVALLISGAYVWRKFSVKPAATLAAMKVAKLTTSGNVTSQAISPDGKYVAYDEFSARKFSIWLREVGTTNSIQLIAPEEFGHNVIAFSSAGDAIYYIGIESAQSRLSTLFRVPVFGGTPTKVLTAHSPSISFSPDGNRIAFIRSDLAEGLSTISTANADGSSEQSIVARKAPQYFPFLVAPAWSPDGKLIACVGHDPRDGYFTIVEVKIIEGTEKRLTSHKWSNISGVTWLPDMSGLVVTAQDESVGNSQIWHVSYPNGQVRRISNDVNSYHTVSIAQDGRSLVTTQFEDVKNIWLLPDADINRAKQITSGRYDGSKGIDWTSDGRIVFASDVSGNSDIWIVDQDGANLKRLTTDSNVDVAPAVSPDGRYIVFVSNRAGVEHIWRMGLDGTEQRQLTDGRVERNPKFSPDSKWVVYNAWESGKATAWRVPIEGGVPVQIIDTTSFNPVVSPDGKSIVYAYVDGSHGRLAICPFEGGQPTKTFDVPRNTVAKSLQWSSDGTALMYSYQRGGVFNIWSQPIVGGPPKQVTHFISDRGPSWCGWSADYKQLACALGPLIRDVILISDFR